MKRAYIISAVICMFGAVGSAIVLSWELRPFLAPPIEEVKNAELFASADFSTGFSSYSKEIVMKDCLSGLLAFSDIELLYAPARAVVEKCFDRAGQVVARTPSDSFAWFVKAVAASRLIQNDAFNEALQYSQKTAPNEQWIARERFALTEFFLPRVSAETIKSHENDLALLVSSYRGVKLIARRYVVNPEFRARITAVVENLSPEDQRRFVLNIKQAMREI